MENSTKTCRVCKQTKPTDTFTLSRPRVYRTICKSCDATRVRTLLRQTKMKAIAFKGGKCQCCGYNKYFGALDFHHLDPSQKESTIKFSSFSLEHIIPELEKCILVCSNCHREIHGKTREVEGIN